MRPAGRLPRVIQYGGDAVYAPWCWYCDSDACTKWDWMANDGYSSEAICLRCERVLHPDGQETHVAREPQRLEARLAELRREVRRSA